MSKIKIAELFYSIQGEGRYMGVPSIFLRTFGCNFTCAGFNMPAGESSTAHDVIAKDIDRYSTYEELPIVATGCDSYASWDPRFKHLSPMMETDGIADRICELLPGDGWEDEHLVITGGEPLLGWQRAYPDLLDNESMQMLKEITFETNGTQKLSKDFKEFLTNQGMFNTPVLFSVSPKLWTVAGEKRQKAIKPEVVAEYYQIGEWIKSNTSNSLPAGQLKFVLGADPDQWQELEEVVDLYRAEGVDWPVFIMPVGATVEDQERDAGEVARMAFQRGYNVSGRLHCYLWGNAIGT